MALAHTQVTEKTYELAISKEWAKRNEKKYGHLKVNQQSALKTNM
jgi:hypothetical protein